MGEISSEEFWRISARVYSVIFKLMKIKPYISGKLAEPIQGRVYHKKGSLVVISAEVHTKSIGDFLVVIPDPVSLSLNNAKNFLDCCKELRKKIDDSKERTIFSKTLSEENIRTLNQKQLKKFDPALKILRRFNDADVYQYMQNGMGFVISLITAIESFLNLMIPHDYKAKRLNKNGVEETLDKDQILWFSIEEKLKLVAEINGNVSIQQEKFWNSFKVVKSLRDDIIHFKNTDKPINEIWNPIIKSLFDSDFEKFFKDVVGLINHLKPGYIEL